ncbi:MAG: esterase, partial [Acidimicrobiia bacterium]|nr:esterase [Acidimicrobiia bacterium]
GASAGGGLAAALALLVRDRGELQIGFQMLVYPMIDDRFLTESSTWNDPVWPAAAGRFGWTAYLTGLGDDVPYHAAPSRAIDLTGLPPTLVYVGALDTLCDEDVEYATRLRHAGVATELMVYAGAPHGFDGMAPGSAISRRARRHSDEWLAGVMRAKRDGGS